MSSMQRTELQAAYDRGRFLDVYRGFEARHGHAWPEDFEELQLATRTLSQLQHTTAAQLGRRRMWSRFPERPAARRHRAYYLLERERLLEAIDFVAEPAPDEDPLEAGLWLGMRATVYATVRDFVRAEQALDAALSRLPEHAWLLLDRAWIRFRQDRLEEATDLARDLCARNAEDCHAHEFLAICLHEQNQQEESIATYRTAAARFQSPRVTAGLAHTLIELDRHREAIDVLEALLAAYPWPPHRYRDALVSMIARAWHVCGDREAALRRGREVSRSEGWFVAKLEDAAEEPTRRVKLDVPFVRQEHLGCVPASLAAVLRYFGEEIDVASVADEITYAGTASHRRRAWCLDRGYVTREFEFDAEVARDLIDRGIPFLLTTHGPLSSHQQAIIGYDATLGTWLSREPGFHQLLEADDESLRRAAKSQGCPCFVVVPNAHAEKLPQPPLPLELEMTAYVELEQAIFDHRAEDAHGAYETIAKLPPCPLRWNAQRLVSTLREDVELSLAASRAQHETNPEDAFCQQMLTNDLHRSMRWTELRSFLEHHDAAGDPPPHLAITLVQLLGNRKTDHDRAHSLARRACRAMPTESRVLHAYAALCWNDPTTRMLAVRLFRIASCLAPHDEYHAHSYFQASLQLGEPDEALAHLEDRLQRLGARSSEPAGTLAHALSSMHRGTQAVEVLEQALARREHPHTRQQLVHHLIETGRLADAESVVAASEGKLRRLDLALLRAGLARASGDARAALDAFDEAAVLSPQHDGVQGPRLQLLADVEGPSAARTEALRLAQLHPHHPGLARIAFHTLCASGDLEHAETLLRDRIRDDREDSFSQCMLPEILLQRGDPVQALAVSKQNTRTHAHLPSAWLTRGDAAAAQGDPNDARESYRHAFELDPTDLRALTALVQVASDEEQAAAEMRFVFRKILEYGPGPMGLEAFVALGRTHLSRDELADMLRQLEREFPGDPHSGEALCSLLIEDERLVDAEFVAQCLIEVFPWRNEPRLLLARARLANLAPDKARDELEAIVARDPTCARAWVMLGETWLQAGELERAERVFDEGRERNPGDHVLCGYLADLAWQRGRREHALTLVRRANELASHYDWGIRTEITWLIELGRLDEASSRAKHFTETRATSAAAHMGAADVHRARGDVNAWLASMKRALDLDPRLGRSREEAAVSLAELGRIDEAREIVEDGLAKVGRQDWLLTLRARLTWRNGEHEAAIKEIRDVVAEFPDDRSAWTNLLDWLEATEQTDEILALHADPPEALQRHEVLYGYAASVLLDRRETERAKTALRRAIEIEPNYEWARINLANVLRNSGQVEQQIELFAGRDDPNLYSAHGAAILSLAVAAAKSDQKVKACAARILREPSIDPWSVSQLSEALDTLADPDKSIRELSEETDKAIADGVTLLWAMRGDWQSIERRLTAILADAQSEHRLARLLEGLHAYDLGQHLFRWVTQHVTPPVEKTALWGTCGAIVADHDAARALDYMADDFRRPDAKPWMLAALGSALRELDRLEPLAEVVAYAWSLPADNSTALLAVLDAYGRYRAGDIDGCAARLELPYDETPQTRFERDALLCLVQLANEPDRRKQKLVIEQRLLPLLPTTRAFPAATTSRFFAFFKRELVRLHPSWTTRLFAWKLGRAHLARRVGSQNAQSDST